jgi:PTS system mannose-specific IIA component
MIGVVIVTHGRLAHEFRAALEHVVGPQEQLETVSIGPDDDLDERRADMLSALARVDNGGGVVVLTDMFGGTPSNLAISAMERDNVEVIAGVNLPMLVKFARQVRRMRARGSRQSGAGGRAEIYQRGVRSPPPIEVTAVCRYDEPWINWNKRGAKGEERKRSLFRRGDDSNKKGLHGARLGAPCAAPGLSTPRSA